MTDYIYNTDFVRASQGGRLVVDSATLISLAKADRLDLLFASNRHVVITETALGECTGDTSFPIDARIADWVGSNPDRVTVDDTLSYPTAVSSPDERSDIRE